MILVDLYCPMCDEVFIDKMVNTRDEDHGECPSCGQSDLKRVIGCHSFELKYDPRKDKTDWHGNTSRYWNDVKEPGLKSRHGKLQEPPDNNGRSRGDKWI